MIEPFGGSFALIRNMYIDNKNIKKYVNDNDERLYYIYTHPEEYKNLCIELNNLCLENLNENGNVIYANVISIINNLTNKYDSNLIEYWKQNKIVMGRNVKYLKNGVNLDKSIEQLKNINFSFSDWYDYTIKHSKNPNAFIFLDPPYLFSDNSGYSQLKKQENKDYTDIFYKILEIFKDSNTKAKIMLIINDMKILRWMYKDYILGEYIKIYGMGKRTENQLIICNYKIDP